MIALSQIKDIRTQSTLGYLIWQRKGKKGKGYVLGGFKIFLNDKNLDSIETTTRSKFELLSRNLFRIHKSNVVKTEFDLEMAINAFVDKHSPYITFNDIKPFTFTKLEQEDKKKLFKDIQTAGFRQLNERYLKKEFMREMKRFRKKR